MVGPRQRVVAVVAERQDRAGAIGPAQQRSEAVPLLPIEPDPAVAVERECLLEPVDVDQLARRRDEKPDAAAAGASRRRERRRRDLLAQRRRDREAVEVDAQHRTAELGVVAAAEPRGELADARTLAGDEHLGVARPLLDSDGGDGRGGDVDRFRDLLRLQLARPRVRERDAEGGRVCGQPVGHRQRPEAAANGEGVDRHLPSLHELFDEECRAARCVERDLDGRRQPARVGNEREAALPLPIRRLDHARVADPLGRLGGLGRAGADLVPRLRHPGGGEPFALAELRRRERSSLGRNRMREAEPLRDTSADRDRPVDPGRDQPVDAFGRSEPLDRRLVLGGDDRAAVGVAETGRGGIAVDSDHVQLARPRGREQSQLRRSGS